MLQGIFIGHAHLAYILRSANTEKLRLVNMITVTARSASITCFWWSLAQTPHAQVVPGPKSGHKSIPAIAAKEKGFVPAKIAFGHGDASLQARLDAARLPKLTKALSNQTSDDPDSSSMQTDEDGAENAEMFIAVSSSISTRTLTGIRSQVRTQPRVTIILCHTPHYSPYAPHNSGAK